jgi:hypothetical protein
MTNNVSKIILPTILINEAHNSILCNEALGKEDFVSYTQHCTLMHIVPKYIA